MRLRLRLRAGSELNAAGVGGGDEPGGAAGGEPAERHLPVPIVALHGAVAVATVVLVLLTALGVGGD
jgi:hypothetical protein